MGQARLGRGARIFGVGIAAVAMATGAYAYTAGNTMPDETRAGDGSVEITGYGVTGVEYDLDDTDPSQLDAVRFTLDAEARTVKAKVDEDAADYADCTGAGATNEWTCALDVAVFDADELTVIATD